MSVGRNAFPNIRVEGKDWSGLTTRNHLGALFGEQPELISNYISRLEYLDLGEDLLSYLEQFPVHTVEDGEKEFEWLLQGAEEKNIPLVKITDLSGNTYADSDEVGKYHSRFLMWFPEKYFFKQHVIVGQDPDTYKVLLRSEGEQRGTYFVYEGELLTGDPELSLPVEERTPGSRWSIEYSLAEQTLSKDGSDISFSSPFRMGNRLSFIRKKHLVPGNMINAKENNPVVFGTPGKNGKPFTTWLNRLDWELRRQTRREKARLLMFGKSNRQSDGSYANIGDSGYEIKAGMGLREQISPSNILYYNKFNIETMVDYCLSLSVGKLPQDSRRFVIGTGEHGLKVISRAIEKYAGANALQYNRLDGLKAGSKGEYRRTQFVKLADINGITLEFMHIPQYDDTVRNKVLHPDGGVAESHRMTIMDFGTADGKPNIQLVRGKGCDEIFAYLPGLRDPYSPSGAGRTNPKMIASSVDGYEIHVADWLGIMVRNPMRMGEWIPNVY